MSDKQVRLYNGEVSVVFTEKNHLYTVQDASVNNGEPFHPSSVTQILKHSNKPALVQWAANSAAEYVRENIKPGIAYDELQITEIVENARFAHRHQSKKGQDFGTLGHRYLESYIRSQIEFADALPLPVHPDARSACEQMVEWLNTNVEEYVGCEILIYSRKLRVASQLDVMAFFHGHVLVLTDWKFASGVWNEYRFQTAAYSKIYEECYGALPVQRVIPLWDKKTRQFKPTLLGPESLEGDFAAFCGFIPVHHRISELEAETKGGRSNKI